MAVPIRLPGFLELTLLLAWREAAAKLASIWFFAVASAVCLIAFLYGTGFQQSFETESVLVTTDPLMTLNVMVVVFLGLVLGLRLASGLSWEREHRTLEVLLVGPVPYGAVVAAKFAAELCVLVLLMVIYCAYLVLGQPLGAGVIGMVDALAVTRLWVFLLPVLALGVLVSAWAGTVRGAVVAYLVIVGVLCVFEATLGFLTTTPVEQMSLSMLHLRTSLEAVGMVLRPVSAVAWLADLVWRMVNQSAAGLADMAQAAALAAATLAAAVFVARSRGAQA